MRRAATRRIDRGAAKDLFNKAEEIVLRDGAQRF